MIGDLTGSATEDICVIIVLICFCIWFLRSWFD